MRPIKFRAWDKKLGVMVTADSDFHTLDAKWDEVVSVLKDNPYESDEWYPARSILGIFDYFQRIATSDDLIVMQYTGLKDKNGKEIYEGDVVRWSGVESYTVKWDEGDSYEGGSWMGYAFNTGDQEVLEVIGNIYENPELLNG